MKTKKRTLISLLLVLCLCLGMSPLFATHASAADLTYEVTGGKLYFDATTGTITKGDKTITEADIPSEIYGVPVITIHGDAFYNNSNLKRVTIPDSVTTIKDRTFYNCSKLTEIVIPDSVTSVGQSVFQSCTSLTSVTIGRGMTSIPREMFYNCTALKNITIPDNITSIGFEAFAYSGLTSITIPDSVTLISDASFEHCTSLTSVCLPDSVTTIGNYVFQYCSALTDVRLSNALIKIPGSAFLNCNSLESIVIPHSVKSIGNSAFSGCKKLNAITIPKSVTSIGALAFGGCGSLTDVYYGADAIYWSQISTGTLNDGLDQATIRFSDYVAGFKDVFTADYYADAVKWAKDYGVTNGTSDTTFSPDNTLTRAEAVTFLWRAAGSPEPSSKTSPFTDVTNPNAYYYKAVLWAAEQGITNGVSATAFGLNGTLAYDQIFTFLCRASGVNAGGSDWSNTAFNWAKQNGLTDGLIVTAKDNCPRSDLVYCLWKQLA